MSLESWKKHLQKSFGHAPEAPDSEFAQIVRKTTADVCSDWSASLWPGYLCLVSLSLGILVTIFVKPNITTEAETPSQSLFSTEVTSTYDESLDTLKSLCEAMI